MRKEFPGGVVAVHGLDLDIADGEFVTLLGPSGSGKTTVLRMIAGFERPTAGTVSLRGRDVTAAPPFDRDVHTVFQDYALFPHLSVRRNVEYPLRIAKVPRRAAPRARRWRRWPPCGWTGWPTGHPRRCRVVSGSGWRWPARWSGARRCSCSTSRSARSTSSCASRCRSSSQQIQRAAGITFVLVTHDQDEALTLADRIVVFDAGRVEQVGPAHEVYERPATPFVAGFVGTSNLLRPEVAHTLLGRDGTWSVRPEKIGLTGPADDPPPDTTTAIGTVSEIVYTGATTRCLVALEAPDVTGAARLTVLLVNDGHSRRPPERGEPVRLFWRPEHEVPVA